MNIRRLFDVDGVAGSQVWLAEIVARLRLWHEAGQNAPELLPYLTVYLGHLDPRDTYWYLTATTELLASASTHFETANQERGLCR